jgi:Tfp pilus assembly protein PilE
MGQQQLLLIVLGFIVVTTAVIIGINMYTAAEEEANREALVSALTQLGTMAQEYYHTPVEFAGGNRKFKKWKIPKAYENYDGGKFKVKFDKKDQEVTITATGTANGRNNKKKVEVEAEVKPRSMKIKTLN